MTVRAASLAFIAAWLLLGLYFMKQGLSLHLGSISSPAEGFMPFVIGIILIGFCIASALPLVVPPQKPSPVRLEIARLRDPAIIVVSMIAYTMALERVGFVATTAVLIVFLAKIVGRTTLVGAAMLGGAATVACYVVFGVLLGIRLP